jgi:hypothetical protein
VQYLLARIVLMRPSARQFIFDWIDWRIRHNADARKAHYRRRFNAQL